MENVETTENAAPGGTCGADGSAMNWIRTTEKHHPDKPGLKRYEQVPCLVVHGGEILLRQWNCEHLVWDTEDGDDYFCDAVAVSHWMPLPPLPNDKLASLSGGAEGLTPADAGKDGGKVLSNKEKLHEYTQNV